MLMGTQSLTCPAAGRCGPTCSLTCMHALEALHANAWPCSGDCARPRRQGMAGHSRVLQKGRAAAADKAGCAACENLHGSCCTLLTF